MAYVNFETREIHCKVLYYGPHGAGKTENFRSIYKRSMSKLTLKSETQLDQSMSQFEFLPLTIGQLRDFTVKLHLYISGNISLFPTFNFLMSRGLDGTVFVADSCLSAFQSNIDSYFQLKELMASQGGNLSAIPSIIQYNKRDHADAMQLVDLKRELNPAGYKDIEAAALQDIGTLETVQKIASEILENLGK